MLIRPCLKSTIKLLAISRTSLAGVCGTVSQCNNEEFTGVCDDLTVQQRRCNNGEFTGVCGGLTVQQRSVYRCLWYRLSVQQRRVYRCLRWSHSATTESLQVFVMVSQCNNGEITNLRRKP
ncbi:hypothetical protein J6590_058180 [Homalodisca vitripennis]|nr:hypothetical protein J6590_058180 [Homalodisca vitripennis]